MPATTRSLFLVGEYFSPTSSDTINVLGYATSVYKIGEISIKMAAMLELMPNVRWPSVPSEATVLSLDKFHIFIGDDGDKNVLELNNCFCEPAWHQPMCVFK